MQLPVLLYHHVGPQRPGTVPGLTVPPERFRRHVHWLARRGYTGISPADLVRGLRERKALPNKPILLTFDDAYADLAEYAMPVLRRYRFNAAVFVVTGQVGGTNAWDEARGFTTLRLMTAEQIRFWATQGIEFGAHSVTHADLTTLASHQLAEEVMGSGEALANLLGSRVVSFAYPYGSYNPAVCDCVREIFDLAFRVRGETPCIARFPSDLYRIPRAEIYTGDSLAGLAFRVRWGRSLTEEVRARVRFRTRIKNAARFVFGPYQG